MRRLLLHASCDWRECVDRQFGTALGASLEHVRIAGILPTALLQER